MWEMTATVLTPTLAATCTNTSYLSMYLNIYNIYNIKYSYIYNIYLDQDLCQPLGLGPLCLVAALAPLDVQHQGAQPLRHLQPSVRQWII